MYHTVDELNHFAFEDAIMDELEPAGDCIRVYMENVKILPDNSCTRDIRMMRTNDLELDLIQGKIVRIVKEGYRQFNADGVLMGTVDDEIIPIPAYAEALKGLVGATVYSLEQKENLYIFTLDTEESTFNVEITAVRNEANWERFINL